MIARSFALAILLAGCGPSIPGELSPPPPVIAPPAPTPALAPVTTLAGAWRVAGIDGEAFDEPYGIALSASDREIWWAPRCAGYARSYRIEGDRFTTGSYIGFTPPKPGEPRPPICLIAPPRRIGDVFAALASAGRVSRTPQNGVEISGGGHSLLLFSQ